MPNVIRAMSSAEGGARIRYVPRSQCGGGRRRHWTGMWTGQCVRLFDCGGPGVNRGRR